MKRTRWVSWAVLVLVVWIVACDAHEAGQEYTYLSMFSNGNRDFGKGEDDLRSVYEQLSLHNGPAVRLSVGEHHGGFEDGVGRDGDDLDIGKDEESDDMEGGLLGGVGGVVRVQKMKNAERNTETESELGNTGNENNSGREEGDKEGNDTESGDGEDETEVERKVVRKATHKHAEDIERLQMMVHKLIKQYDIRSIADVPCRAHSHWIPNLLSKLDEEDDQFRYYCVDTNREMLKALKSSLPSLQMETKFVLRRFWYEGIPRADMVLSWSGLDNMQQEHVRMYLHRLARTKGHKLVAVGSSHSGKGRIDVRKRPFSLRKPLRIIGDLSTDGSEKQLYLYEPRHMKKLRKVVER